jgi:hypothetical protein
LLLNKGDVVMPGIGILSTVPYTGTAYATAFDQGFNMANVPYRKVQDNCGYDANSLNTALQNLIGDGSVTLIVAVGGLATEVAATNSSKDYISLVGTAPASPGAHSKGRVSLGSVGYNQQRRTHLHNNPFNIPFDQHCLLSNDNSAMSGDERSNSGGGGIRWGQVQPIQIGKSDTPQHRQQKYANAFNQVGSSMRAVIISADPYFKFTSNELVTAADTWVTVAGTTRRVCYPFQEYGNDSPTANKTSLCGPSIVQGYNYVGQLAAHTLDSNRPKPGNLPQACNDI